LRKALKAALFATKRCVFNAPPLAGIEMSPLVNEWDAVTKNPAAPTAGFFLKSFRRDANCSAETNDLQPAVCNRAAKGPLRHLPVFGHLADSKEDFVSGRVSASTTLVSPPSAHLEVSR
jgi:hypothetical protein